MPYIDQEARKRAAMASARMNTFGPGTVTERDFARMPYRPGTGKTIPIPNARPGGGAMKTLPYKPKPVSVRGDIEKAIMTSMSSGGMFGRKKRLPKS